MSSKKLFNYVVVIPARYNSSRLPGKLLLKLGKETVLEKVVKICLKVVTREKLIIATDNKLIFNFCKKKAFPVMMTSKNCLTGSDRVYEIAKKIKRKFYINVQGDEILLNPKTISKVINFFKKNRDTKVINCYTEILREKELRDTSIIKTIFDKNKNLKYMSRSPIPGNKLNKFVKAYKQVCVYGFNRNSILFFGKKKNKSHFEKIEDIEILRFIENSINVKMIKTTGSEISIDTYQDYLKAKKIFNVK